MITLNTYKASPSFGMTNNSKAAKEALKNVDETTRQTIVKGVDTFCKKSQQKGIKGDFTIKKVYKKDGKDYFSYSMSPNKKGTAEGEIEVRKMEKLPKNVSAPKPERIIWRSLLFRAENFIQEKQ